MPSPALQPGLPPVPDFDTVAARYRDVERTLTGGSRGAVHAAVRDWDAVRRELETWANLTNLRFTQDTRDAAARAAREQVDAFDAVRTGYDAAVKRRLVDGEHRHDVERTWGDQALRLWTCDLATYEPAIEADLVTEAQRCARYTELLAAIEVDFDGARRNLPALAAYATSPDRALRYGAARAQWTAMGERAGDLDGLFDELVHLRTRMARTLGYDTYTALGYARMHRIDYGHAEVERWRDAVREHVVPLAAEIVRRAAQRLGVAAIARWDERFLAADAPPAPIGDARTLLDASVDGFAGLDPQLGAFARMMDERELTDLVARPGKAGGGYCTGLPALGVPFVFTNFNGSSGDVTVLMHEFGHAFQAFSSRDLPLTDYLWSTHEAAEVDSMSLEFLSWPLMERFFGERAEAYRRNHLTDSLLFLPYGVAVDHFQHLVYALPDASPDERHAMWRWCEQTYLPWRTYGDLERPARGAFWQSQQHIYRTPFYYIDYTLALCCALQMWASSVDAPAETLARYVALCARGGSAPFRTLIADAGITEPFDPSALPAVVARARAVLGI